MKLARLPMLVGPNNTPRGEVVVAKADSWFESWVLGFVPGRWYEHAMFGRLRVLDLSPNCAAGMRDGHF